jgi:hypothetical protein
MLEFTLLKSNPRSTSIAESMLTLTTLMQLIHCKDGCLTSSCTCSNLTGLILPQFCACPKPEPGLPTLYVAVLFVFSEFS